MKWNYKCEKCNCALDPGEGRICSDCREKHDKSTKIKVPIVLAQKEGQYSFDLKMLKANS